MRRIVNSAAQIALFNSENTNQAARGSPSLSKFFRISEAWPGPNLKAMSWAGLIIKRTGVNHSFFRIIDRAVRILSRIAEWSLIKEMVMTGFLSAARFAALVLAATVLTACGGAKVLKEPQPITANEPIAAASSQRLAATLDWIIVRDGPGTWSRNADWDEYLLRVRAPGDEPVTITRVTVTDSLGTRIAPAGDRKALVKGSRQTVRRYKGEGLKVKAGAGAGTLIAVSAGVGATAAAVAGSAGILTTGGAAVAAGGLVLVPAIAVGGVVRGINNSKVNAEIDARQTTLPVEVGREAVSLDLFFPLAPAPRQIEITWVDTDGENVLVLDTHSALGGLHIPAAGE